ncbi:hypothetical protein Zmor_020254 [Zophobas morio]|mgnify:CR=1 FL=1|uniref:Uncharacterized protein n=1 Tax=Zophobas morio TaxID=2755281 RepID=A0AA38I312_9CUCU|nr:hypothetical protein Zmor_020254 [Zophobas morio]
MINPRSLSYMSILISLGPSNKLEFDSVEGINDLIIESDNWSSVTDNFAKQEVVVGDTEITKCRIKQVTRNRRLTVTQFIHAQRINVDALYRQGWASL